MDLTAFMIAVAACRIERLTERRIAESAPQAVLIRRELTFQCGDL
jgi:hypothetical protein